MKNGESLTTFLLNWIQNKSGKKIHHHPFMLIIERVMIMQIIYHQQSITATQTITRELCKNLHKRRNWKCRTTCQVVRRGIPLVGNQNCDIFQIINISAYSKQKTSSIATSTSTFCMHGYITCSCSCSWVENAISYSIFFAFNVIQKSDLGRKQLALRIQMRWCVAKNSFMFDMSKKTDKRLKCQFYLYGEVATYSFLYNWLASSTTICFDVSFLPKHDLCQKLWIDNFI